MADHIIIVEIQSEWDWKMVQTRLLYHGVKWTHGHSWVHFPVNVPLPLRFFVYQQYNPGLYMSYGKHSNGISAIEFLGLDFKEYLFEKLL